MARTLSKKRSDGSAYTRDADIEASIDEASGLDAAGLLTRVKQPKNSPAHLKSEVLVSLIRSALERGDLPVLNTALAALLQRCDKVLLRWSKGDEAWRADVSARIAQLFVDDRAGNVKATSKLDYWECRFNHGLALLIIDQRRREKRRDDFNVLTVDSDGPDKTAEPTWEHDPTIFEERERLTAALDTLTADERRAIVLHYIMGLDQETIGKRLGVSSRTLRTRLREAKKKLKLQMEQT